MMQRERTGDPRISDTSASPFGGVGLAALDVGITCPIAASLRAGDDAVDVYRLKKVAKYKDLAERVGWKYYPVTMSCFGRPHDDSIRIVQQLARAAARKYGVEDEARIEKRWWASCSTMLAERAANMILRCSPTVRLPAELGGDWDPDEDGGGNMGAGLSEVDVSRVVGDGSQ